MALLRTGMKSLITGVNAYQNLLPGMGSAGAQVA